MERTFNVYQYKGDVPTLIGTVRATSQTHADTKAKALYKHSVWTKEKERA